MTVYKRREFRVGDLVTLNQTKLRDIPASLVSFVLSNVGKIVTRFRIVEADNGLARIKHTSTAEEFSVPVSILVASYRNQGKGKKAVVNINGCEVVGDLIKFQYYKKGKLKKENGEVIRFNSSKNNLGFIEKI